MPDSKYTHERTAKFFVNATGSMGNRLAENKRNRTTQRTSGVIRLKCSVAAPFAHFSRTTRRTRYTHDFRGCWLRLRASLYFEHILYLELFLYTAYRLTPFLYVVRRAMGLSDTVVPLTSRDLTFLCVAVHTIRKEMANDIDHLHCIDGKKREDNETLFCCFRRYESLVKNTAV